LREKLANDAAAAIAAFRASYDARLDWQPVRYGGAATPKGIFGDGSLSQLQRTARQARLSLLHRLSSIAADVLAVRTFVELGVWETAQWTPHIDETLLWPSRARLQRWPLIGNRRCGLWYVSPQPDSEKTCHLGYQRVVHFKSVDGHSGSQRLSTRFLNLPALLLSVSQGGLVIVDATRSGKLIPDALQATLPLWCAVMNALWWRLASNNTGKVNPPDDLEEELAQWLRLCCSWNVEASDRKRMTNAAAQSIRMLWQCESFIQWFQQRIHETNDWCVLWPCTACRVEPGMLQRLQANASCWIKMPQLTNDEGSWATFGSAIDDASVVLRACVQRQRQCCGTGASIRIVPIVGVSASDVQHEGQVMDRGRYRYVAGAGDDEESWSRGLAPSIWWRYHSSIQEALTCDTSMDATVHQCLAAEHSRLQRVHQERRLRVVASVWDSAGAQLFIGCCASCTTAVESSTNPSLDEHLEETLLMYWLDAPGHWSTVAPHQNLIAVPTQDDAASSKNSAMFRNNAEALQVPSWAPSPRSAGDSTLALLRRFNHTGLSNARPSSAFRQGISIDGYFHDEHSLFDASLGDKVSDFASTFGNRPLAVRGHGYGSARSRQRWNITLLEPLWPRLTRVLLQERRSVVLATAKGDGLALVAALVWLTTNGMQQTETALQRLDKSVIALQCRYPAADLPRSSLKQVRALLCQWASQQKQPHAGRCGEDSL
jgi:hypothetical protein